MNVLSLNYLPNVLWMRSFLAGDCIIDVHEHFIKQTYRNRAVILSANGPLNITIPVKKTHPKMVMIDLLADEEVNWQKQHWESIAAAYGSAPYFIHYADAFKAVYDKQVSRIADFELELLALIIRLMKVKADIHLSENYIETSENDLRTYISPKNKVHESFKPYLQVFAEKFPFQPNLSIVDALFNLGPRTHEIIGAVRL